MKAFAYIVSLALLWIGAAPGAWESVSRNADDHRAWTRAESHAGPTGMPAGPPSRIIPQADTTHRDTTHNAPTDNAPTDNDPTQNNTTQEASAWQEDAWNEIAVVRGVQFAYLYYTEADNVNDGVVLRLHNRSDCLASVGFDVIFRAASMSGPGRERIVEERYRLAPGERKTGENDGLFYIPFPEGESIAEVGLRGVSVRRECP